MTRFHFEGDESKFFGCPKAYMEFLGQGWDLSLNCDLSHNCSNVGSLTHCSEPGIEPVSLCPQDAADPIVPQLKLWNKITFKAGPGRKKNFLAVPVVYGSSRARDWIPVAAVTYIVVVTRILKWLCHSRNSRTGKNFNLKFSVPLSHYTPSPLAVYCALYIN